MMRNLGNPEVRLRPCQRSALFSLPWNSEFHVIAMSTQSHTDLLLPYFLAGRPVPDFQPCIAAILGELRELASEAQLNTLLRNAGLRMGRSLELPFCRDLREVETAMNEILRRLGWGVSDLEVESDYLRIRHLDFPWREESDEHSERYLYLVRCFEGLYTQWLWSAGAERILTARHSESERLASGIEVVYFDFGRFDDGFLN